MKVKLPLLLFVILLGSSFKADPIEVATLISEEKVEMTLVDFEKAYFFKSAEFLEHKNQIAFKTTDEIQYIQVFNSDNVLEYQLPILAKKVTISKSLFSKGSYRLVFTFKNQKNILFSDLVIK